MRLERGTKMKELVEQLSQYSFKQLSNWLHDNGYEYMTDVVDVYTTGNEDDFFEIDIWFDNDCFVTMYYKFDGTFRRYKTNDF